MIEGAAKSFNRHASGVRAVAENGSGAARGPLGLRLSDGAQGRATGAHAEGKPRRPDRQLVDGRALRFLGINSERDVVIQ